MSDESLVTIEVDGQQIQARAGSMLIEATDGAGIAVPRFCYHKKLSIAANCRMCLVEVEKAPKPLPACATPVMDGMKVYTRSPLAIAAQKGTMEFLLINHPLDCPICDQGGECELQDVAMGYGGDVSRFTERKRVVPDQNIGPLIATDMTRCIHCTRCVRFGAEIAGVREMGATGRGEHTKIGTYVERSVNSELSGNIIDLCPVGALTSKPFRFTARAWELAEQPSVAMHDCVGSNIFVHTRGNKVLRVVPRDNESINETWLSDRDRFSYEGLQAEDRLTRPMIKRDNGWQEIEWEEALEAAANKLRSAGESVGALVSHAATAEEMYLLQKLVRKTGSNNIDSRLRQRDFRADTDGPRYVGLGMSISALSQQQSVLLIGSNIRKEQPILGHRLRMAAIGGADVTFVNPVRFEHTFDARYLTVDPARMVVTLAAVAKAAGSSAAGVTDELIASAEVEDEHKAVADALNAADQSSVLLGVIAQTHPDYALLLDLARVVADATNSTLGFLTEGANAAGAVVAGARPNTQPGVKPANKTGLNASEIPHAKLKAVILLGLDPALDHADGSSIAGGLAESEAVIALSAYRSESLEQVADILLPVSAFTETAGTYINVEGLWQSVQGCVAPPGDARPAWKVLRVLGNLMNIGGFEYNSAAEIKAELSDVAAGVLPDNQYAGLDLDAINLQTSNSLTRVLDIPLYSSDQTVRRAVSLQKTHDAADHVARVNEATAGRMSLAAGERVRVELNDEVLELELAIDDRVADDCVWISAAIEHTAKLGGIVADVDMQKVDA